MVKNAISKEKLYNIIIPQYNSKSHHLLWRSKEQISYAKNSIYRGFNPELLNINIIPFHLIIISHSFSKKIEESLNIDAKARHLLYTVDDIAQLASYFCAPGLGNQGPCHCRY